MNGYDLAYLAAAPFFLSAAFYKRWRHGKYKRSLPGMFGANLPKAPLPAMQHRVWMHSVSFGETIGAAAVYRSMQSRHPDWEYLSTTTTETGQDQARKSMAGANYHDFAPVDLSWKVGNFLNAYNPSAYLFFETEIWPNTLAEVGRRGTKTFLVNGDLSEKSARNYARLKGIFQPPLSNVTAFVMQTEEDADRLRGVIGRKPNIFVTGNVKFDNLPEAMTADEKHRLRESWGVAPEAFLVVAGSTHDTEEKLIYHAFAELRSLAPTARLVIAPRHPERFGQVLHELKGMGADAEALYRPELSASDAEVLVLNSMGVLSKAFGAGDVALVGGSWKTIGGHNLLEPAAHGLPVLHGPHMHEQKEIMHIMRSGKASLEAGGHQLAATLIRLHQNPALRAELGRRAMSAANSNRGAAQRTIEIIERFL
ncbi:3-deoxy-D-manno-octulosonic acid transferase [Candidatus Sumerlaeota bacterium]|nr:3-deoxy-D-manno-octulosonic acid transferase [Candidatus Sumerlaeota bacterium]